jgi:hypothetical protein
VPVVVSHRCFDGSAAAAVNTLSGNPKMLGSSTRPCSNRALPAEMWSNKMLTNGTGAMPLAGTVAQAKKMWCRASNLR